MQTRDIDQRRYPNPWKTTSSARSRSARANGLLMTIMLRARARGRVSQLLIIRSITRGSFVRSNARKIWRCASRLIVSRPVKRFARAHRGTAESHSRSSFSSNLHLFASARDLIYKKWTGCAISPIRAFGTRARFQLEALENRRKRGIVWTTTVKYR